MLAQQEVYHHESVKGIKSLQKFVKETFSGAALANIRGTDLPEFVTMNVSTDPRLAAMEKLNNPFEEMTALMREVVSELKGIKREVSRLSATVTTALRERSSSTLGDLYHAQHISGMDTCGLSSAASSSICGIDESIKSPTPRFDIDEDIKGLEDGFVQISMKPEAESKLAKVTAIHLSRSYEENECRTPTAPSVTSSFDAFPSFGANSWPSEDSIVPSGTIIVLAFSRCFMILF